MAKKSSRSHIFVLPYPAQGHIPPLLGFSRRLADQGALVTLANVASIHCRLKNIREFELEEGSSSIRLESVAFPYDIPYGYDASCHLDQGNFVQALRGAQFAVEDLLARLLDHQILPRISCIVADYLWGWHLETARKFGIPCASYWPGSATWNTVHYHLPLLISAGDAPIKDGDDRIISYVPGLLPTSLRDFPYYSRTQYKGTLEYLMQEQEKTMRYFDERSWLLINSNEELEPQAFKSLKAIYGERCVGIGPLFTLDSSARKSEACHSLREEDGGCIAWLDNQAPRSVVYISFGSVATISRAELQELSRAISESNKPFLWVLRPEQDGFKETIEEFSSSKGMIVPWAPQLQVLAHKSVGGFLSHCGWNSIFEAISSGVPVLGWPCVVEQNLNCKVLVHDLKAGLKVEKAEKDEIKAKIESLMSTSSGAWERAQELKAVIQKAADAVQTQQLPLICTLE